MTEQWTETSLGDHVDLLTGFPFKSSGYTNSDEGIRLLRGDNVGQGSLRWHTAKRWPAEEIEERVVKYHLQPGDVIVAMDRPWIEAGLKYAVVGEDDLPALLVQRVARLRARDTLDPVYLGLLIGSPRFTQYILGVQTGTAVPHISGKQIADFRFRLPPLSYQRRAGEVIRALAEKVSSNRRLQHLLKDLAEAHFDRMCRAGHGRHQPVRLGDLVDVVKGRSYKSAELSPSTTALVTLKSISREGGYSQQGAKPYTGPYREAQLVEPGEIVVAHTDLTQAAEVIGRPALIEETPPYTRLVASLDLAVVRPTSARLSPAFLYLLLQSKNFHEHARRYANGSTVLHLDKEAVPSFEFALPTEPAMRAFSNSVDPLFEMHRQLARETSRLVELRDRLVPALVEGRTRLTSVGDTT